MKKARLSKILELIEEYEIETQEAMLDYLNDFGINVTQATVSRDISELKLTKTLGKNGKYKYIAPQNNDDKILLKDPRKIKDDIYKGCNKCQ